MKLLSQCSRAETEYARVYVLFKEACCLKWDNSLKINEAYESALEKLSHLQKLYPYYQKIYQQYKIKITGLYNSSVIFYGTKGIKNNMFEVKTLVKNKKDALNLIEALRDIGLPAEISITFLEEVSNEEIFECFPEFPFYDIEVQRALIKQYQIERMNQEEEFWIKMVRREKERRIQEILKSNL